MLKVFRYSGVLSKSQPVRKYGVEINKNFNLKKAIESMLRIKPLGQPPKVWQRLEKVGKDGKLLKFTIQEIPEDRYDEAIEHMCTYFVADEPTCDCWNSKNDPLFLKDISYLWKVMFSQNISIAAFIDNPDGGKPILAGMNALGVSVKGHEDGISGYEFASPIAKNTFELIGNATKIVYEHYGVKKYLNAIGLSVAPPYRGYGLGIDLLKTRYQIGREYDIPATCTVFTSIFSQKSAAKAGFEPLVEKKFSDVVDENGKEHFPGIKSVSYIVMGKKFV